MQRNVLPVERDAERARGSAHGRTRASARARPRATRERPSGGPLTVVGIGASAGGLEACSQLLHALPPDPGFAIVLVQHLSPDHESLLASLLQSTTLLPVVEAHEGQVVEAGRVYVIPPNTVMGYTDGRLHLHPRTEDRVLHMPIDYFLRSLAAEAGERAIGVVLSGTASDGANGLRDVRAAGGVTFAQDPQSARHSGMPLAAIGTGVVDRVLAPAAIAEELVRMQHAPYLRAPLARHEGDEVEVDEPVLQEILALLQSASGVDFADYKPPTIRRRLQRRIVLAKSPGAAQYLRLLQESPQELNALFQDILIHVTRFFRDPESFVVLEKKIFPHLFEARTHAVRVWVPGCSTGEEPYSIAITLLESLGEKARAVPLQIFATDVSEAAVEFARVGLYPEGIAADISPERLERWFTKVDGHYRIDRRVREQCVFARQDLTRDPPYSRLDLVVCRNVMIYLGQELQQRLLGVFHYALKPSGFLMLGSAETIGSEAALFATVDKKHRLYKKKAASPSPDMDFRPSALHRGLQRKAESQPGRATGADDTQQEASRILLDKFVPAGVLVDAQHRILHFRGPTGPFLQLAPGEASLDVLKLAREGLEQALRIALHLAEKQDEPVRHEDLRLVVEGESLELDLEVIPLPDHGHGRHYLVLFERRGGPGARPGSSEQAGINRRARGSRSRASKAPRKGAGAPARESDARYERVERELEASRSYLQSMIEDLEATNQELQSANEEILSSNEELQSTNEELDTAKEELQSTNEELNTVNDELHGRNEELGRVNSDLLNVLASVQIAIVIIDEELRVRRFTPMAERVLHLIRGDVGRPLSDIRPNIDCPDLEALIRGVVETMTPVEREVRDREGRGYILRIRPYKGHEKRIEGVVLTLLDVTVEREHELAARRERAFSEAVFDTIREPLIVLDGELRVERVNRAFSSHFAVPRSEAEGRLLADVGQGEWDAPALKSLLLEVLPQDSHFDDFEVVDDFPGIGRRRMMLNARRIEVDGLDGRKQLILLAIEVIEHGGGR